MFNCIFIILQSLATQCQFYKSFMAFTMHFMQTDITASLKTFKFAPPAKDFKDRGQHSFSTVDWLVSLDRIEVIPQETFQFSPSYVRNLCNCSMKHLQLLFSARAFQNSFFHIEVYNFIPLLHHSLLFVHVKNTFASIEVAEVFVKL